MIALLKGTLVSMDGTRGIVDVRGVGYAIQATQRSLQDWTDLDEITVHVSTQVREDAIALYGFPTDEHRKVFDVLIGVSGVGPKMALSALDTLGSDGLGSAVESDDIRTLSKIPGVGKKTAQRLALELKGKLSKVTFSPTTPARSPAAPTDPLNLALAQLGYRKSEIDAAQAGLQAQGVGTDADLQDRLRAALQILARS